MRPGVQSVRSVGLFLALLSIWLLWSGLYKPLVVGSGVVSAALCVLMVHRMRAMGGARVQVAPVARSLSYFPWLIREIARANASVIRIVLSPKLPIEPSVVTVTASQRTDLGRVIYGNSITLTPGTLTVDVDGDQFTVHALTSAGARQLQAGDMDTRVALLEGRD